ncbi:uncharacterized protein TRAVEDRAFT_81512, partial [Trametes versicolor FP-101664 SS1]|uniref:uncharacterized protein n=1 Tax=Trametes versicolor (strain FP-101664) TaxID=717944 RepID=UPI0004621759
DIDVVDMYTLARTAHIRREATDTTVIALAEQGYLAASPVSPTLAITFNTLEHFRLLRLRKPSFSVEAFAKVLCDSYALPYRRRYRTALSDCFDAYLSVLRVIEKRIKTRLGRDTPDWRVKNACPACCYELEEEPPLKFARLFCFDGNNSLKRVAKFGDREVADTREFTEGDYFLSPDFVDKYKDEVNGASARGPQIADPSDRDSDADEDEPPEESGPAGDCTRNWKAAAPEQDKKMWAIFDETGIFASACRHGFILWITDMIRSGELFKYPISIVAKALSTLGPRLLIGFDVGCSLSGTIDRSSLGPDFRRLECRCCVDVFHGYSHSHQCQTKHHPTAIEGAGLEDLGTMERVFSGSNQLASVIRYASRYHRHVLIDMYFKQWDEDKYSNLATMLLNNYQQALKIIQDDTTAVQDALGVLECTTEDLHTWGQEEAAYFATVGTEDPANIAAVEYVTLLRELRVIENQLSNSTSAFVASVPEDWSSTTLAARAANPAYEADAARTRKRETERRLLREKWDRTLRDVIALELKMGIQDSRWQPDTPEYVTSMQYISERDYRVALEKLHGLVVQRLFELHNLNISQTAYKVRTYIAKNLQRRSQAIRTAVKQYNTAAEALNPPRPPLDWTKVTHYSFLEEFELLRDTGNTLRTKRWAEPLARETMKKARHIARAHEEILRCNVEVRRLHTSIVNENATLNTACRLARVEGNSVSGPLEIFALRRKRVNARLLAVISQIHALPGYTGD